MADARDNNPTYKETSDRLAALEAEMITQAKSQWDNLYTQADLVDDIYKQMDVIDGKREAEMEVKKTILETLNKETDKSAYTTPATPVSQEKPTSV